MHNPIILSGGLIVDGSGRTPYIGDLWIEDGYISQIVPSTDQHPAHADIIDVEGNCIAPGFIDVHSHADNAGFLDEDDLSKILQGVTTEVTGNCGITLTPRSPEYTEILKAYAERLFPTTVWDGLSFGEFWDQAGHRGLVTNVVPLVGQGTLRIMAMGLDDRNPTDREMIIMKDALQKSLEAGAFGLSTGLIYPPGQFTSTDEIIELASVLGQNIYTTHMRGEAQELEKSVDEAIAIGREAHVQVQISHHKAAGKSNWGKTEKTLKAIDLARSQGQNVRLDVYPYTASSTMLTACLPPWTQIGGDMATLSHLQDPEMKKRIHYDIEHGLPGWENHIDSAGVKGILIGTTPDHQYEGQTLEEIARTLQLDPISALIHVLLHERLRVSMLVFSMHEDDLQRVMRYPWTMIGSDGLPPGQGGRPHPRLFGTFPHVLGKYVRDLHVLSLEEAIRKMTALPAETFGLWQRGRLEEGYIADIVAFNASSVRDAGHYGAPPTSPEGISFVFQRGILVVNKGRYCGNRQGVRLIRSTPGLQPKAL